MVVHHPLIAAFVVLWMAALSLLALVSLASMSKQNARCFPLSRCLGRLRTSRRLATDSSRQIVRHRYENDTLSLFARN
jgi:hypothetical protein